MTYVGVKDGIDRPKIQANGVPVSGVQVSNQIGQIPSCSFTVPPEYVEQFDSPDMEVTINVEGEGGGGDLFKGYVSGSNFSNMEGNLQAGINLIHRARDLDETHSLLPGVVSGSAADSKAVIFHANGSFDKNETNRIAIQIQPGQDFGRALCDGIANVISKTYTSATSGFSQPEAGDKERAIAMLRSIESYTGAFPFPGLTSRVGSYVTGIISQGATGNSLWDLLGGILSSFDLTMACSNDGRVAIVPNFSGVKSPGIMVPGELIQRFDQSSEMKRSPKEAIVIARHTGNFGGGEKASAGAVGRASVEAPGSRGSLMINVPGWLTGASGDFYNTNKDAMDALAKSILIREVARLKTCNLITPVIPGAMPGGCLTFKHLSSVKGFDKGRIGAFEKTFDGYCWKVTHTIGTDAVCSTLHFQNVSDGTFQKQSSHPIWSGGTMPTWS